MTIRDAHLVGSYPATDARDAMEQTGSLLGERLPRLPDGETGERANWIIPIIERLRDNPALELVQDGDWSDYDRRPAFRVRRGARLTPESLDLRVADAAVAGSRIFEQVRDGLASRRADVAYQVSVPGHFDLAFFTFVVAGPMWHPRVLRSVMAAIRHRRVFASAMAAEIRTIHDRVGADVVYQIELPVELIMVAGMPRALRSLVARLLARVVTDVARGAPVGARMGVHLCLGDMNHRALGRMRDAGPLVALTRAITRACPLRVRGWSTCTCRWPLEICRRPRRRSGTGRCDGCGFRPGRGWWRDSRTRIKAGRTSDTCSGWWRRRWDTAWTSPRAVGLVGATKARRGRRYYASVT